MSQPLREPITSTGGTTLTNKSIVYGTLPSHPTIVTVGCCCCSTAYAVVSQGSEGELGADSWHLTSDSSAVDLSSNACSSSIAFRRDRLGMRFSTVR
jgi:hypothetical protein